MNTFPTPKTAPIFPDLPCAWAGCKNRATKVTVQMYDLEMIFESMAGVLCDYHAAESGLPSLSFAGFGAAAKEEL